MSLDPRRGLTPAEQASSTLGKPVELPFNLGNGFSPVKLGLTARVILKQDITPDAWFIDTAADVATVQLDVQVRQLGTGAYNTIFTGGLAGLEPEMTLDIEESFATTGWPVFRAGWWLRVIIIGFVAPAPKQVGFTIWGTRS